MAWPTAAVERLRGQEEEDDDDDDGRSADGWIVIAASPTRHRRPDPAHHGLNPGAQVQRLLCQPTHPDDHDHERRTLSTLQHPPHTRAPLIDTRSQVLSGIADTVAQTLTAFRIRQQQRQADPEAAVGGKDDLFSVEIHDLVDSKRVPWPEHSRFRQGPPPFEFERMIRFMSYAFIMTPLQHRWFGFLNKTFPVHTGKATLNALKRMAFDQLLFAPCGR